jgi:hypothetical protein
MREGHEFTRAANVVANEFRALAPEVDVERLRFRESPRHESWEEVLRRESTNQ